MLACWAWGQSYSYRYWIDDNVGSATTGSATGEAEFTVNTAQIPSGIHAIHVQAKGSGSDWSSVQTRYFLAAKASATTAASARYWIDNEYSTMHNDVATSGTIDIDLSGLGFGLHAVHYQKIATDGTLSSPQTRYFLVYAPNGITAASARYWIDNDSTTIHNGVATSGVIDIDLSKLGIGLHAVHYQKIAADGTPSSAQTRYFYVDHVQNAYKAAISIDGGEASLYDIDGEDIVINMGDLQGDHQLRVVIYDEAGKVVSEQSETFTIGPDPAALQAANDAKKKKLDEEITALQSALDSIVINRDDVLHADSVVLGRQKHSIQEAIDTLQAEVNRQAEAVSLTAESTLPDNTIAADIDLLKQAIATAKSKKENLHIDDVSQLADAMYASAATALKGGEGTLTINLKNAQSTSGYSFELLLPDGVTVDGYTLSSRHNGHSETMNYNATTGVYSFAVLSLQSKELKGNDGAVWILKLKVADGVAAGDYAVSVQNAKYSLTSGSTSVSLPDVTSLLTIEDYKKGDANGDGAADIADAVCIVNHVVGKDTPSYVAAAADANGDGVVDIADAVRVVNLVVGKIDALSRGLKADFGYPEPQ